nr:MAG TPA: hypothetical protein [Inoviridae sp.]
MFYFLVILFRLLLVILGQQFQKIQIRKNHLML